MLIAVLTKLSPTIEHVEVFHCERVNTSYDGSLHLMNTAYEGNLVPVITFAPGEWRRAWRTDPEPAFEGVTPSARVLGLAYTYPTEPQGSTDWMGPK